ncbi:MAG TPA: hypothetical protein VH639_26985 [Bryobacteraceae bacterium]|jgi:hypothetical protein
MKYIAFGLLAASVVWAQQPLHDSGQSVTPAFEGWFPNPDGTFSILWGYYNRNLKEDLDIRVGDDNRMEPGGRDQGQPTHFLTRRQWGVFTVTVPKDFGSKKLTWTLTSNGATWSIPASLDPLWLLSPSVDATGNTPPFIGFDAKGPFVQGPRGQSESFTAKASEPLTLPLWVADDASVIPGATRPRTSAVTLAWSKFRGPGAVKFSNDKPAIETADFAAPPKTAFQGKAVATATFSEPGEYVLRVVANDWSGDGGRGFQCCWSNAQVNVSVK